MGQAHIDVHQFLFNPLRFGDSCLGAFFFRLKETSIMPVKLNVGLSKKVTDGNYGSRGASVNLELELENAVVGEPAKLQEKIRQLFAHVRASLHEELNCNSPITSNASNNGQPKSPPHSNGQPKPSASTNGNGQSHNGSPREATQSQVKAIFAIAKKQGIEIGAFLQSRFRVASPAALSLREASQVIDELKANGDGG
jgi:hypothetical protein